MTLLEPLHFNVMLRWEGVQARFYEFLRRERNNRQCALRNIIHHPLDLKYFYVDLANFGFFPQKINATSEMSMSVGRLL